MSKKKTGAEIFKEAAAEMEAEEKALLADAVPEKPDSETEKAETGTEKPETGTKKRDWVEEAYKCFIKDAKDMDPTDPVTAIEIYFERHATRELLARCKAEGKDAKGCWKFIEAVARKALGGRNGHIDPAVVYAIAMHWFEDVPKDWDKADRPKPAEKPKKSAEKPKKSAERPKNQKADDSKAAKPKKPAETPAEVKKEKAKAAAKKAKKPRAQQGFFFEMLETPTDAPETEQESEVKE